MTNLSCNNSMFASDCAKMAQVARARLPQLYSLNAFYIFIF